VLVRIQNIFVYYAVECAPNLTRFSHSEAIEWYHKLFCGLASILNLSIKAFLFHLRLDIDDVAYSVQLLLLVYSISCSLFFHKFLLPIITDGTRTSTSAVARLSIASNKYFATRKEFSYVKLNSVSPFS
jgi:hypothetical protein